jgi:hypothetical protein
MLSDFFDLLSLPSRYYFTKQGLFCSHKIKLSFKILLQADLVVCDLFICNFMYVRLKIGLLRNLSPILYVSLVFLYANSLHAKVIFWSLSLAYNEVRQYIQKSQTEIRYRMRWSDKFTHHSFSKK